MKKYFILLLLSLICNLSNANKWNLLKSGERWNILQVIYNPDMVHHDSTTYFVKFEGDTIINAHTYSRVLKATDVEFNNWTLNGFVREDTLIGFYYRSLQEKEGLLYKYNLRIGDSVVIINTNGWSDSIRYLVAGIDSVQIEGKYKKRYIMNQKHYEYMPETWIEGVGSSLGILNCGLIDAGGATRLLCCYENNVLIYKNPDYQDCYYSTNTALHSIKDLETGINVYSGTTSNVIFIKSQVDNYIRIFNSYGMFIEVVHVLANLEYNLNVAKYSKGVYVISPSTNSFGAKKFIVY
ncbi:MAG: hypothetical protein Q8904_06545 [Bacteroidota bacterium]|nr:hypothetical protein [Bacteroidota bacterium]